MNQTNTDNKPRHIADHHWQNLAQHRRMFSAIHLRDMFANDPLRAEKFSAEIGDIYIDYSKHFITDDTMARLFEMAHSIDLCGAINALFNGEKINHTENRAAMHMALRAPASLPYSINGKDISAFIHEALQHMERFVEALHAGDIKGYSGKSITTVVTLGIGGSHLGPKFAVVALSADFSVTNMGLHFVSGVDRLEINTVLKKCDAETTLFILSSKSFTTKETLANAQTAVQWLRHNGCDAPDKHLVAVTANHEAAKNFSINDERIFPIWQWVGGRYSLWSSIGLPIAIKIGMRNFRDFLDAAFKLDQHFKETSLENNIPVLLALIDMWNINFFGAKTLAIFPYDHALKNLPPYLGQLFMESNGKQIDNSGERIHYATSPVIWGDGGADAEHAYFQFLHQGTQLTPVDFIVSAKPANANQGWDHQAMVSRCFAQSEALMRGNITQDAVNYQSIFGDHPSSTLLLKILSPATLGTLISLYEHRCFVQSQLWNINPFDQWGVELGKRLSQTITDELDGRPPIREHDTSTRRLITHYQRWSRPAT